VARLEPHENQFWLRHQPLRPSGPPSALRMPDELHLRVEAIEDTEVVAAGSRTL